jgi:hypothetical protein
MIIKDIHRNFKIFLDKVDSSAYSELNSGEIDVYLNEAIERLVKQRYGGLNIHRTSFEESQKRTDDLKNLVVSRFANCTASSQYLSEGLQVYKANLNLLYTDDTMTTLSADRYMLFIKCLGKICKDECCSSSIIKLIQQDDIDSIKADPFNKPKGNKVNLFFEEGNIYLWVEQGKIIEKVLVTFIKKPAKVNLGNYGQPLVECDLSEYLHSEVIQIAVGIALENLEMQRQGSQESLNTQRVE